jgi:signal transduction histidine kinase
MLPPVLAPLDDDRRSIERVLDVLEDTSQPEVRADLAGELVRVGARYQDAMERGLYTILRNRSGPSPELEEAERRQHRLREAMNEIRRRTLHLKPLNAHADDPEGFEAALGSLIAAVRAQLDYEDHQLLPLVERFNVEDRGDLRRHMEHAVAHASSHPDPSHNPIGRAVANLKEKLDRVANDTSTPWHPGWERLEREGEPGSERT